MTANNLEAIQFDFRTAFLYVDLSEELEMKKLEGFVDVDKKNHVQNLQKAIYGLMQASRAWRAKFKKIMQLIGCTASGNDLRLFIYVRKTGAS